MIDQNTDFFAYVDNFAKIKEVDSVKVFGDEDSLTEYTIAIPTYKRTEYLKEAIDSALNQDCTFSYNIIVVDNNPERGDDTEKMMESYKNSKIISYYKNAENLGMAGNWNRLFQLSKTKRVVMLHDDDVLYPFYLSKCDLLLQGINDVGVLKPKEDTTYNPVLRESGKIVRLTDFNFYYGNICGTPSGMLFDKEKFISSGGYNQDFYPSLDYCFHVRFSSLFNFYFYDSPLMYYRIGVNESLKVETQKKWLNNDSYLIKQILNRQGLPNFIINDFISRRTIRTCEKLKQTFHSNFTFSLDNVGLKPVSQIRGILAHAYIKLHMYFKI